MGFQRELAPFGRVFRGNAPKSPLASGETLLAFKNGAGGEKCDSISRRGEQDRPSLLQSHNKFISKTCQWHVLDVVYLYHCTKATACAVVGEVLSCRTSPF